MKKACIIMLCYFIVCAILSTIGCILEWSGKCDVCEEHESTCNILSRARVFSALCTIVLWICGGAWAVLTADYMKEDRFKKKLEEVREIEEYIKVKG